jgi:hypothetical protein
MDLASISPAVREAAERFERETGRRLDDTFAPGPVPETRNPESGFLYSVMREMRFQFEPARWGPSDSFNRIDPIRASDFRA